MKKTLETHPIWDELEAALEQIDMENLAMQHLKSCHYKLSGYWTEDEFYEEIALIGPIRAGLISMSIGKTNMKHPSYSNYWIRLQFALKHYIPVSESQQWFTSKPLSEANSDDNCDIGELVLVLAPNLEIIDENWFIDVESPFVVAKFGN